MSTKLNPNLPFFFGGGDYSLTRNGATGPERTVEEGTGVVYDGKGKEWLRWAAQKHHFRCSLYDILDFVFTCDSESHILPTYLSILFPARDEKDKTRSFFFFFCFSPKHSIPRWLFCFAIRPKKKISDPGL